MDASTIAATLKLLVERPYIFKGEPIGHDDDGDTVEVDTVSSVESEGSFIIELNNGDSFRIEVIKI